jgi:hypothetical protein
MAELFENLKPRRRLELVGLALNLALADVAGEITTRELADKIVAALGSGLARPRDVGRVLAQVAKSDPRARLTGESFVMYGRTMQRSVWQGGKAAGASQKALDAREAALYTETPIAEPDWSAL